MKNVCKFLVLSVVASVGSVIVAGGLSENNRHSLTVTGALLHLNNPASLQKIKNDLNTNPYYAPVRALLQKCTDIELKQRGLRDGSFGRQEKEYYAENCSYIIYSELSDDQLLKLSQLPDKQ